MRKLLEWGKVIAPLLLAVLAGWYAWETRGIRQQNETEIKLYEKEMRLRIAPRLVPGVINWSEYCAAIEGDEEISAEEKDEQLKTAKELGSKIKYLVQVLNPSTNIAIIVDVVIYDLKDRSFLTSISGKEYIKSGEQETFVIPLSNLTLQEIKESFEERYEEGCGFIFEEKYLNTPNDHYYIAVVYQDIEGRVYMVKRIFEKEKNGSFSFHPSKLYCEPD